MFQFPEDNLIDVLDRDYPDILKAIKKEGYNLDFLEFDIFDEITFENQIVGFIAFKRLPLIENHFEITDVYIIPEFRGNNLLFEKLSGLLLYDNFEFYPRKPTKAFIKVLLKNDHAFQVAPNFVVSYMKFIVDADEIYKNSKIKRFYRNADVPFPYKANLFDMELCSVMFGDPVLKLIKYSDFFALTEPRKYDLKKYKCRKKLKRVSEKYIDDKFSIWENKYNKIEEFIERKDDEFEESLLVENILGSEDELVEDFIERLDKSGLSVEDGFKIRKHVADGLEKGQLTMKSYIQRVSYLLDNFADVDKTIDEYDEDIEECPFCADEVPDFARSCLKCGLHIREIDFEKHAAGKLHETIEDMFEALMEKVKTGNLFEDNNVVIEENDELEDVKLFFNAHMLDYEWEEFLEFYKKQDETLGISEIRDLFLEDKLNNALNTKDDFDTYFTSIVHYCYYNQSIGELNQAFVNMVQMAILASNKSKDKRDILESNPHSIDIFFVIEDLERSNHKFDVLKLFNQAVDTFRIDKYNNNHDEVLSELEVIFK